MEGSLHYKLIRLMLRSRRRLADCCEPRDLTPVQGILLVALAPDDAKTMNDLSEIMGCDASNITGLVDRLEGQDLISRKSDKDDRRVKQICLTKKGKQCRCDLLEGLKSSEALDLSKLTAEEKTQLEKLIDKVL